MKTIIPVSLTKVITSISIMLERKWSKRRDLDLKKQIFQGSILMKYLH